MQRFVLGPNAARGLKKLLRGKGEVSRRKSMSDALAFSPEYAAPYTVQWAASANDGEGAWIIWLPGAWCLLVDGERIDVIGDLEPAGGDYPAGWYRLDFLEATGGNVYLNVRVPGGEVEDDDEDEDDDEESEEPQAPVERAVTADFGDFASGSPEDGERVIRILVATVSANEGEGTRVQQNVTGAVFVGTGDTRHCKPFDLESGLNGRTMVRCVFSDMGHLVTMPNFEVPNVTGNDTLLVYLRIVRPEPDEMTPPTYEIVTSAGLAEEEAPNDSRTRELYPLYLLSADGVMVDYRDALLTVSDASQKYNIEVEGEEGIAVVAEINEVTHTKTFVVSRDGVDGDGVGVKTLNDEDGDIDIIGGSKIRVTTKGGKKGHTIIISYDEDKVEEDEDPNDDGDGCEHPAGDGGADLTDGGGPGMLPTPLGFSDPGGSGGGGGAGEEGGSSDCCSGGQGTVNGADGEIKEGLKGKPAPAGISNAGNGKTATSTTSNAGKGKPASSSSGLQNYSTIPRKAIGGDTKTPLYSGTHAALTDTKKMNESPFKNTGNYRAIGDNYKTPIYDGAKTPLYNNTHGQLTDTKKMNTNPWASGRK